MNKIVVNNETSYQNYSYLSEVLYYTLEVLKIENVEFSVILTDEKTIKNINKKYRHINKVTDVISFAFEDNEDMLYNDYRLLGDIYICIPIMIKQALEYQHTKKRELSFLGIHGLLHLLGYGHDTKEKEKIMREVSEGILSDKNFKR